METGMSGALTKKTSAPESLHSASLNRLSVFWRMVSGLTRSLSGGHASAETSLWIDEKLSLGPKKMLFLVNCGGRQFLVATGADTVVSMVEVSPVKKHSGAAAKLRKPHAHTWQKRESLR
jgi:hypothetical protein